MVILITLLILTAAFFAGFTGKNDPALLLNKILTGLAYGLIIFLIILYIPYGNWFSMLCGILIMYYSFTQLGIFNSTESTYINVFSIYIIFTVVMSLKGLYQIYWVLYFVILFITCYLILFLIFQKKVIPKIKSKPYFKDLLDMIRILSGIFLFITGFIIAIDRIQFLEKIAEKLFN